MYDENEQYVKSFGLAGQWRPVDVAEFDGLLYVVDSRNRDIKVFNIESGEKIRTLGRANKPEENLGLPTNISISVKPQVLPFIIALHPYNNRFSSYTGSSTLNTLPLPGTLSTSMNPCRDVTSSLTMASPIPAPPNSLSMEPSTCSKGMKMASHLSAGMPIPRSRMVTSTASGETVWTRAEADPLIEADWLPEIAAQYAGDTPLDHPGLSPLFADLTGLPPMLVQTASDEVLLSDSTRLVERAAACPLDEIVRSEVQ